MTRKMRWSCVRNGCFRNLCPRLGEFDDCFPGKIGMSDIDGVVEISGRFLFLEWKAEGGALTTGQRIMFERMTGLSRKITVIVVRGDPKLMAVNAVQVFEGGRASAAETSDLAGLKQRVSAWAKRVRLARARPSKRVAA